MKLALLTCSDLDEYVTDEHILEKAVLNEGWTYDWIVWTEEAPDWNEYDAAIIRTTWDYIKSKDQFLKFLSAIESSTCKLYNSMETVKWNSDKKYLLDLEGRGVATVPTRWYLDCKESDVKSFFSEFDVEKIVIKPNVGAGAFKTYLLKNSEKEKIKEALESLSGIEVMVQPYMKSVAEEGEYSLHFFNGKLSHSILKKPKPGDFRSQEEFGSHIVKVDVESKLKEFAESVLNKIDKELLYARVDIIRNNGSFNLIELELIEPSLYFRFYEPSGKLLLEALKELYSL